MLKSYLTVALAVLVRRPFLSFVNLFATVLTLTVLVVAAALLESMLNPGGAESAQRNLLVVDSICLKGKAFGECSGPGLAFYRNHLLTLKTPDSISYATTPSLSASYVDGRKITPYLRRTDHTYWEILKFKLVAGRFLGEDDVKQGRFVAVVNEATAAAYYPGVPNAVIGKSIVLDSQQFEVVGVVVDEPQTSQLAFADVWVPYTTERDPNYAEQWGGNSVVLMWVEDPARRRAVQLELSEQLEHFVYPPDPDRFDRANAPAKDALDRVAARALGEESADATDQQVPKFISGAIVLALVFMLLPAVNMANLNLGRIMERAPEIGLRKAVGASKRALVGQFVFENLVVAGIGGLISIAIAPLLLGYLNTTVISHGSLELNARVFVLGLVFVLVFGILSGAYPAWRMSRLDPVSALKGLRNV
jgi:putative ABC transport system permease protein